MAARDSALCASEEHTRKLLITINRDLSKMAQIRSGKFVGSSPVDPAHAGTPLLRNTQDKSRPRRPGRVFLCCMAARDSALCASSKEHARKLLITRDPELRSLQPFVRFAPI